MSPESDQFAKLAQEGLEKIETAILKLLEASSQGITNSNIATELGLRTSGLKGQKNYLTWSILQELVRRETLTLRPNPNNKREILYSIKSNEAPLQIL